MKIINELQDIINSAMKECGYNENVVVTFSDRPELCDFQCNNAFALAKKEHKAPFMIANEIVEKINSDKIEVSVCNPGFININLKEKYIYEIVENLSKDQRSGIDKNQNTKKVVIDYGGANSAKPLHVGHLRSAIIGESIKRLAKFLGDEVISDVHLGDWGLQMGLTISGLMERMDLSYFFKDEGEKPVITMEMLNEIYPYASKRSKIDEEFKKQAQEITFKLQNKEKGYYQTWQEIQKVSIKAIKEGYGNLNLFFDLWYGESNSSEYVPETIKIFEDKKLTQISDGAEIVEVAEETDNEPMPPLILKASSGADLYATTDLATILMREKNYKPDAIWYVTDARQALHFKQVFRATRKAKLVSDDVELLHIPYGTMNGKDGKPFKTRDGGTMKLSDLIEILEKAAEEKLKENNTPNENNLAKQIGVAALKFGDLINYKTKDYVFDLEKFSSFEGKTGPYILYSMVRIKSILAKAGKFSKNYAVYGNSEKEIVMSILKLSSNLVTAYDDKAPSFVCSSLYDIASSFSTFYNNTKILTEQNQDKRNAYLTLLEIVLKAMQICTEILAIDVPEKM